MFEPNEEETMNYGNYSGWQLQKAIDLSRQMGWEPFQIGEQPLPYPQNFISGAQERR